jgi:hypothetical protein
MGLIGSAGIRTDASDPGGVGAVLAERRRGRSRRKHRLADRLDRALPVAGCSGPRSAWSVSAGRSWAGREARQGGIRQSRTAQRPEPSPRDRLPRSQRLRIRAAWPTDSPPAAASVAAGGGQLDGWRPAGRPGPTPARHAGPPPAAESSRSRAGTRRRHGRSGYGGRSRRRRRTRLAPAGTPAATMDSAARRVTAITNRRPGSGQGRWVPAGPRLPGCWRYGSWLPSLPGVNRSGAAQPPGQPGRRRSGPG